MTSSSSSIELPRFEWIYSPNGISREPWNEDLTPEGSFATIPSIGAFFEGWLLQIPRIRCTNYSHLSKNERTLALKQAQTVAQDLCSSFQCMQVYVFEHGAVKTGSTTGCGVDQAHLHIVACAFDLFSLVERDFDWADVDNSDPWSEVNGDYLLLSDFQRTITHNLSSSISQYFRKKIANKLDLSDRWNYQEFPQYDVAIRTAKKFNAIA